MSTLGQGKGTRRKEKERSINYGKSTRGITCKVSHAIESVAWLDGKQAHKTFALHVARTAIVSAGEIWASGPGPSVYSSKSAPFGHDTARMLFVNNVVVSC